MLEIKGLTVSYGAIKALQGIDLTIEEGEIVSLLGANGAGKTTALRAVSRLLPIERGDILFQGKSIAAVPVHSIVSLGIAHVPEGRGIFPSLTVLENLKLATWTCKEKSRIPDLRREVFRLFPRLEERKSQLAGTLSGGEQQMLALGRAMMTDCKVMLLDEPSMGLSPLLVKEVFRIIREINAKGTTILLVEQNANMALKIADRGYVLETGRIVLEGSARDLAHDPRVKEAYLGHQEGEEGGGRPEVNVPLSPPPLSAGYSESTIS
ncbi:ABC transporter ATP-binding protein [Geomonas sp. RF6]|uniref:ABC transporter ATP-binding protein n=1 Tax=Geomonas sp. RF6 TaxID=2897342 RepID=UPI001E57911F|nr:ABC transporter ATP-binding protein [Geomonas sp. RF6]UFS72834.1 ABC transporter ATP-binding protein [Geomonas sp. RF6]